jgi:sec-independent protein translocase protein TatB
MFDITSSKLLLLGIVALLVIGPKDFPVLLRTIGKYVGIIRGHAKEFRAQFDEAMRETELAQLKKDVENIAHETETSFNAAGQSVEKTLEDARRTIDEPADGAAPPGADPLAHDANGLPIAPPEPPPADAAAGGTTEEAREHTDRASGDTPVAGAAEPVSERADERSRA